MPTMKRAVSLPSSTLRGAIGIARIRSNVPSQSRSSNRPSETPSNRPSSKNVTLKPGYLLVEAVDRLRAAADGDLLDAERGAERRYGRDVDVGTIEATSGRFGGADGFRSPRLDANVEMGRQLIGGSGKSSARTSSAGGSGSSAAAGCRPRAARCEALELREPPLEVGARLAQGVRSRRAGARRRSTPPC